MINNFKFLRNFNMVIKCWDYFQGNWKAIRPTRSLSNKCHLRGHFIYFLPSFYFYVCFTTFTLFLNYVNKSSHSNFIILFMLLNKCRVALITETLRDNIYLKCIYGLFMHLCVNFVTIFKVLHNFKKSHQNFSKIFQFFIRINSWVWYLSCSAYDINNWLIAKVSRTLFILFYSFWLACLINGPILSFLLNIIIPFAFVISYPLGWLDRILRKVWWS